MFKVDLESLTRSGGVFILVSRSSSRASLGISCCNFIKWGGSQVG